VRGLRQGLAVRVQRAEGGLSSRRGSSVRKVFERYNSGMMLVDPQPQLVRGESSPAFLPDWLWSSLPSFIVWAMLMIVVGGILWLFLFGSDRGSKVERGE
jgi:hypothetical protein